jgi:hypothetical protein
VRSNAIISVIHEAGGAGRCERLIIVVLGLWFCGCGFVVNTVCRISTKVFQFFVIYTDFSLVACVGLVVITTKNPLMKRVGLFFFVFFVFLFF